MKEQIEVDEAKIRSLTLDLHSVQEQLTRNMAGKQGLEYQSLREKEDIQQAHQQALERILSAKNEEISVIERQKEKAEDAVERERREFRREVDTLKHDRVLLQVDLERYEHRNLAS